MVLNLDLNTNITQNGSCVRADPILLKRRRVVVKILLPRLLRKKIYKEIRGRETGGMHVVQMNRFSGGLRY